MSFELKPFQRVLLRNGREGIITNRPSGVTPEGTDYPLLLVLNPDTDHSNGYMPGRMVYSSGSPEWDVVKVWDYPSYAADLLDYDRKGSLLWAEESPAVARAKADVESAKGVLAAAEERLAALL